MDTPKKHPRALYTLFFTEMWERFSYYGMRALLVLFMVETIQKGGMGMTDKRATAIYGLYTAAVYLAALPGGWLADRILGARQAIWYGGIIIALGHFTLAIPRTEAFYLGLMLVVFGTGLLKPNISATVGELYPEGGARRDAGFTIFYMGINIGAAIGPLVCSTLGEKVNWHYGFAAAGVGMVLGLIQYRLSVRHLGTAGLRKDSTGLGKIERVLLFASASVAVIVIGLGLSGVLQINPIAVANGTTSVIVGVTAIYFTYVLVFLKLDPAEKRRVGVIIILFLSSAIFWAIFEQAGSTLNLFAERYTDRSIKALSFVIPAGWYQSLGPVLVISLAPVVAAIWINLAKRNLNPSLPIKFAYGLIFLAGGFIVMAIAAKAILSSQKVGSSWLFMTYLLHTVGELCLSPVGLSSVTKLAPPRLVGQMMGTWFMGTSLGNLLAGIMAGTFRADAIEQMPAQYFKISLLPVVSALLLIAMAKPIRRWIGEIT